MERLLHLLILTGLKGESVMMQTGDLPLPILFIRLFFLFLAFCSFRIAIFFSLSALFFSSTALVKFRFAICFYSTDYLLCSSIRFF
jgi:hypothetical protein